ncbi:hypothetical protein ALC56_11493 [Trachymyrmex septentrionalis]|uniref:Uncharacterized protein n=1 Tax=Trachymyrmex septentrionalis TaxID=34720 RepID=A0A195F1D4_9HYME|nr:hypothetical protein ALC56_11493 [Trachymyrmex septentrionalis]
MLLIIVYYWKYLRAVSCKSHTSTEVYVKSSNDMLHLHPISKGGRGREYVGRKGLPKPCQRSSIVGALAKLSTDTSDERDRSRACAIMMARCFSQSPGINYRYAPTDVVAVTPRGASLKHASPADALLRDARGIVSLRFFVFRIGRQFFPDAMSENDFIARDR